MARAPIIESFFEKDSSTFTHLVRDPRSRACAVVDPAVAFDPVSGAVDTTPVCQVIDRIRDAGLNVKWILETHVHADHLSGAAPLRAELGGQIVIGRRIDEVARSFDTVFPAASLYENSAPFDRLVAEGDVLPLGSLEIRVIETPGHTPACVTYVVGDAAFVGDTLFMPDTGSARCDFPGGCAETLYVSIRKILSLPDDVRLFMCHDYATGGRAHSCETTVGEEKAHNIHVGAGTGREDFIAQRIARDKTLSLPRLFIPSIQVNLRAGETPPKEVNGVSYLKLPLNVYGTRRGE
ncbi:MAG: MBL fold metallo-hydrolase [Sphingomonadales bacterium]|nr:MBL fold metallo-hydrolase [Sphingomonadales bacterium]